MISLISVAKLDTAISIMAMESIRSTERDFGRLSGMGKPLNLVRHHPRSIRFGNRRSRGKPIKSVALR